MDEKQLKALWESMSATHELGDFDAFKKNIYSDSNFRKGFWQEAAPQYEIGDYKTFEDSFKKKVPLQPSPSSATPLPSQEPQKPKNPQYLTILGEGQPTPMTERQKKMPTYLGKTTNKLPNIEEAINDATEKAYKNRAVKSPVVKEQIIDAYKNGYLVPVIENGKSVMKRGAGHGVLNSFTDLVQSFSDAVKENHERNLEDSYVSTLPKDKAISYLNAKMASPETFASKRETAPSGFLGKVGEFLGENIPMLGKATTGAIAGTTLAPETGGSSFGMFLANAKDMANAGYAQNLERNYQAIKEQNPKISDSEAYDKANKAALVGETTSLATNAVLSYAAPIPKNIPTPIPSVETNGVINSLTHAIKSYPKVGGTAVAGSLINDITANLVGNKVEASEMIENAEKSAIDMASMLFGLWALGQPFKIPSYIRPQIENVVASAPREEVKQFYTEMENRGAVPEGTTNKVIDKLEKFDEQKQVVQNMDLSQEQQAAITGKLLQRAKIEEENRTLKKYGGSFNSKIDANQKLIDELDAQIDGITKTKDVLKFERDNITGEKPSEIGKSVEEQLKPVEEIKVRETETPTEEVKVTKTEEPITNEEKVKQLSDADIEKRMIEIEGAKIGTPESVEFNDLEKEMEKRERATVFNVPLEKVNDAVNALIKKEKEQPNGYGSFIEKRDALETKEVADRYLNAKELTDAELRKDFKDAIMGNPDTWYADGLKLRESMKEASNRGVNTKDLVAEVEKEFIKDGYTSEDAKETLARRLATIFKVSQKETPKAETKEQPKAEVPKAAEETKSKQEIVEEVKKEVLPKEEVKIQEPPIVENIVDGKRKKVDLSKGKKAEIPKDMVFKDEKEHDRFVVDNSENPAEIASIYVSQPKTYNLSSIEMMIAEFGIGKVKFSSYKEYGDGNNMTLSKARSYINKKGRTLDGIAKEMSDHYDYEITPEDLIDFIDKFPNGESSALSKKNMVGNDISFDAQQKFYKLTGLKLNEKIAEKAINYEFEKLNKEQKKLIYEQWKSEKELTDAYWEAYKQTDGFTKESNISQAEQPKPAEKAKSRLAPKQDIATQARDLANKLRSGEKQILPDWLKADLPKNTKLSGISFEEAAANALETFADVYEKVKDTAQAISEALVHLRDWHKENNIEFNETEWKQKFEENLLPKEELKKSKEKEPLKVGISHENLNKLAKKLGLKEVKRGQRLSPEEMAHRGRLLYKAGADVEQIAKDFENGMQPTADDIAIVRAHIEGLAKKADALEGKGTEYNEATKELYKWLSVVKEMGTRASEPFTVLQGERDMDTDSFTIVKGEVAKKMEKLGGINAKQERKIRELTEQNKKLKEEAKKAEKKAIEAANKTFGEGQQAQVTFTEKAKKVADNFRKLKTKEFIFRDENGNEIQVHKAGVSWNELIELGAKAIEKTGEIADGVAAIIENIKDKEWYQKLSDKDKSNLEKQFAKQFEDAVEETPEAKKIKRLEKEKEDLENGIIKQRNVSNFKPSPEQQEKINQLTEEIKGLKENLGLIKSKQEKPLTEEEQIEQKEKRKEEIIDLLDKNVLRDLKNPKNMFSIEEKKAIWKYAKEEYLDKGVDYKEMISLVAEDLGLTWSQMNYAITTPETKKISDEMWIKQSNYRKNQNATKRWVEEQNKNQYEKLIKRISDKVRGISVFGHGGIFVGTHAMMTLFDPLTWKQTVPAFFRAWKYAYGNKANYEIAMQELKNMDNYNMAQRAGLKNNPDIINAEEFQKSQNFLGKLGGAGEQGFNAIKVLRQDLFDYHWNKLTESEKLDLDGEQVPMAAKEIAWLVNNATGATNLKVSETINELTFAGGMEMARWSKLTRNPLRASEIAVRALINPKNASTSEKVFAKVWASRVGRQLGFMASMLAVNYALQNAINPKNKVNLTNPKENDFGKFKFGDINVDMSSGMLGVTRFIRDLVFASTDELEELGGDTRMEKMGKSTIQYARGKLAPFYQKVSDIAFNTDFSGNVLPYSSDKPRQGKHKLGWTEYLWQSAPLPIAEAAHAMYESAAEHGGDPKIVDALVMAAISGGTGAKPSLYKEKQLQFSEQDKEREPFKFFVRKGVEFKELNPYKIEIEDEELGVKKPLDEYPKETIDNFKKIHKENLTESLEKIQEKGYVYIDKFGNLSISRGEGKPKEKIDLTELNKEQLKKIVSLLNSDATDKTKKEVFNQ